MAFWLCTGTTVLAAPPPGESAPRALTDVQAKRADGDAATDAPGDAPRLTSGGIRLPAPPIGYNRHVLGWIDFAYPPEVRERIQPLIEDSELARRELMDRLGTMVLREVHVRVARTPGEMSTLAPPGAPYPAFASGVAYPDLGLVLLTLQPRYPRESLNVQQTFRHELAHVALHDAVRGRPVPRWFNEGFAVFASGESSLPRLQTLWTATVAGNLLPLDRLERSFPADAGTASIAYAQAADIVRYLVRRQDHFRFNGLVERMARGTPFDAALEQAYGIDRRALELEWQKDVSRRYTLWPILASTSVLWMGVMALFFFGYRRRKARSRAVLERWRKEEAREDALRTAVQALQSPERVHVVLAGSQVRLEPSIHPATVADPDVPKINHDGRLHTLH